MGKYHGWISLIEQKRGGNDDTRLVELKLHILITRKNLANLVIGIMLDILRGNSQSKC